MSIEAPEAPPSEKLTTTLDLLKALTPCWLELKQRYDRTDRLDAQLGLEYNVVNSHMDELLDQLSDHLEQEDGRQD